MTIQISEERGNYISTASVGDASVNWVLRTTPGMIEARYVRRAPDYFAAYLSSQTGCAQACRMCHLTATRQVRHRDVNFAEFLAQADLVLAHAAQQTPAKVVHFNFMARGEPLANNAFVARNGELLDALWKRARAQDLRARFLVSTILPASLSASLEDVFSRYLPEIYYSLYSMDERVRRRWLPRAMPACEALDRLAAWQRHSYKLVKIHHAVIRGVNDAPEDVHAICDAVLERELKVHVNLVRYNPPSDAHGEEATQAALEEALRIFRTRLRARAKIVPRVGPDVYASCGMFTPGEP